ncbi:MAG: hypothetical protein QOI63_613 [Thermoplasmata archaeon]|nr:hypothetical protein [Thermoplasmata archaeon]
MKSHPRRVRGVAGEGVEFSEAPERRVQWKTALAVGLMVLGTVAGSLVGLLGPQTSLADRAHGTPLTDAQEAGGIVGLVAVWAMVGTLFLGWAWTGVPAMLRWKAHRVDVHNWTSIAVLALAALHTAQFMAWGDFRGWLSGWLSNALLLALFATGWWRAYWVRRWGRSTWRVVHWELALGALALAFLHWLLVEHGKEVAGIAEGF